MDGSDRYAQELEGWIAFFLEQENVVERGETHLGEDEPRCRYCHEGWYPDGWTSHGYVYSERHTTECSVVKARELLAAHQENPHG